MEFATYVATHIATCVATEWLGEIFSWIKMGMRTGKLMKIGWIRCFV